MEKLNELQKCPFCGGFATLEVWYNPKQNCYKVNARCMVCGSAGKEYGTDHDPEECGWTDPASKFATDAWNMRHRKVEF